MYAFSSASAGGGDSSTNVAHATMANTACYDPLAKCIRLPPASSDGGAILEGSIIEMDALASLGLGDFVPGMMLLGEIVEIVIMDENMSPLAVFDETNSASPRKQKRRQTSEEEDDEDDQSLTREELLQKQSEMQEQHFQQSQELLQNHQREKQRLDELEREGRIPANSKRQLAAEMEATHQKELMDLKVNHQSEQSAMMDLIFESASTASSSKGKKQGAKKKDPPKQQQPAKKESSANLWNRAAVTAVAAGAMNQNQHAGIAGEPMQQQQQQQQPVESKTAGLWNKAAVATVAAGTMNQSHVEQEQQQHHMTHEEAAGLWNRAAVTAVAAGTMNQHGHAHAPVPPPSANNATTPLMTNKKTIEERKKELEEQKKEELKAVMRDRSIPKEERIKKMGEIKDKYAKIDPSASYFAADPPIKTAAVYSTTANNVDPSKSNDKLRREEIQAVMKDQSLGKAEKQQKLAEIRARHAALAAASSQQMAAAAIPPAGPQPSEKKTSTAGMWNRAAVSAVTANTMSHVKKVEPQPEPQQLQPTPAPAPAAPARGMGLGAKSGRWGRAKAGALASKGLTSSFIRMKEEQGLVTPISEFIQKLKANDPSLTTIMIDGRGDVSDDEFARLFDSLENNTQLTHLSVEDSGLGDGPCVSLALALVENETLVSLNLSKNNGLTDATGKALVKVLKQSNMVLKDVKVDGTSISPKQQKKMKDILDDRDEVKKLEKVQAARQKKIQELLAFSASDAASPATSRLSQRLLEVDQESEQADGDKKVSKSVRSGSSTSSGERSKRSGTKRGTPKKKRGSAGEFSHSMSGSVSSASRVRGRKQVPGSASLTSNARNRNNRGAVGSSASSHNSAFKSAARSAMTAKAMANLGGDMTQVGKNMEEVRQARKMRGECEDCGQRCFQKTMFKSTPLTIPGKVKDGRCLKCAS